jgi:hypothetical protein
MALTLDNNGLVAERGFADPTAGLDRSYPVSGASSAVPRESFDALRLLLAVAWSLLALQWLQLPWFRWDVEAALALRYGFRFSLPLWIALSMPMLTSRLP